MSAEADALCGAGFGEREPNLVNSRNGYRQQEWDAPSWDTAAGDSQAAPG